jgi:hypothetical protein
MITERSDVILGLAAKRAPPVKPVIANPSLKNIKNSTLLVELGITYEQPLNPVDVVARRNERLNKIKNQQTNVSLPKSTLMNSPHLLYFQLAEHFRLQNQNQQGVAHLTQAKALPAQVATTIASAVGSPAVSAASKSPHSAPATPPPSAASGSITPVVVNITQQAVAGSTATTTVASTAATSGGTTTIQTIGQQIRGPRTTVALTVQAPGGNLLPVTQIQQAQRFTSASLVAAPAGGPVPKGNNLNLNNGV